MKKIFEKHLEDSLTIKDDTARLSYLTPVLRSLLQVIVISIFEIIKEKTPIGDIDLKNFAERFCKPVDGLPVEIFNQILPSLRAYIDPKFMNGWYEPIESNEPLGKSLMKWVQFRNKRPGHGVLDIELAKEWSDKTYELINNLLVVCEKIIPLVDGDKLKAIGFSIEIKTPLLNKGALFVILKISSSKGVWKLHVQELSWKKADERVIQMENNNIFSYLKDDNFNYIYGYKLVDLDDKSSIFHNIPIRQTDNFEGRKNELNSLKSWLSDNDSRMCLVYGDGGYGKTTLILELLNQFIEDKLNSSGFIVPSVIGFYTAKMTRWSDEGIKYYKSATPVMEDGIRELMKYDDHVLSKDWYEVSGDALIDKAKTVLTKEGFKRNDILLIFDNTETLATSSQQIQELSQFFTKVSRQIGRVIVTSRRRENIEARHVPIEGLSEEESISLMKALANKYNAKAILMSGESKIRKVCKKLMLKPLLIEALVKYISRTTFGIDAALESIFLKSNDDLLEFLYEDAWVRMNEGQKQVLFVLVSITIPLEKNSISKACQEVEIPQTELESALEETYFSLTDYGSDYSVEIVDLAKKFFHKKLGEMPTDVKERIRIISDKVDKYYLEREKIEKEYKTDRVAEAFRTSFAKAAKNHVDRGEINDAIEMYKFAIEDDPLNSALHDRFALLLFNKKRDYLYAKSMAEKAISLNENNGDALVTLALIYYQIGEIPKGDEYMEKAEKNGRTKSFCLLRKAIARYHKVMINESDKKENLKLIEEARIFLDNADQCKDKGDRYHSKNQIDIDKYKTYINIYKA